MYIYIVCTVVYEWLCAISECKEIGAPIFQVKLCTELYGSEVQRLQMGPTPTSRGVIQPKWVSNGRPPKKHLSIFQTPKKRPFEKTWNVCDISKPRCCCFDDFSHWWVCFAVGPGSYAVFYWVNRVSL